MFDHVLVLELADVHGETRPLRKDLARTHDGVDGRRVVVRHAVESRGGAEPEPCIGRHHLCPGVATLGQEGLHGA
jgi:hypothetical protein